MRLRPSPKRIRNPHPVHGRFPPFFSPLGSCHPPSTDIVLRILLFSFSCSAFPFPFLFSRFGEPHVYGRRKSCAHARSCHTRSCHPSRSCDDCRSCEHCGSCLRSP